MTEHIGYIRVSTVVQNTDRQLFNIELAKSFTDKFSGQDTNRPQLKLLIEYTREGDVIHVHDISRMARNTEDLLRLVKEFTEQGINKTQIAKQLGCSRPTVYQALAKE